MKSIAPIVAILIVAGIGVGASIGVGVFLFSQKKVIVNNLQVVYSTNEAYRELISLINLENVYLDLSLGDYIKLSEERKNFIINVVNRSLFAPECFKIIKGNDVVIEYPKTCEGKMYGAVIPFFVPGGRVEKLYINYDR